MKKNLLLLFAFFLLSGCAGLQSPTPEQLSSQNFTRCNSDHKQQIQQYLSFNLIDPYSAVIEFGKEEPQIYNNDYVYSIYASVNAKNRFGGYVGRQYHQFVCLSDNTIAEVNVMKMGMLNGLMR
jgi:hypothetical protein